MAEPRRAPTGGPTLQIAITYSNGNWDCVPPQPPQAAVGNGDQVTFHCSPKDGCRVYTDPPDAFVNEANGYEQLSQGNNTFTCAPGVNDKYISYCACDPNSSCTPSRTKATGGYSIQVGNPPIEEQKRR